MKRRSVYWLAVLALLAVPVLAACGGGGGGGGGSSAADAQKVEMFDEFKFSPNELTAKVGEPLKLNIVNEGSLVHDFVVDDTGTTSGELSGGESKIVEVTFQQAGEYSFHCSVPGHAAGGMVGKITVTD
jgi:uncharacterized cupredoxin-like copper-binding protein